MAEPIDLEQFILEQRIDADVLKLKVETPTVEDAAKAVGTSVQQIVKSLLFLVDGEPVLAIACGKDPIDRRPIAAHLGVGRKRVKLADAASVLAITGYPVGAVPPFGLRTRPLTLIDRRVFEHAVVYAGGGATDALVRVSPLEIVRVSGAIELDLLSPT